MLVLSNHQFTHLHQSIMKMRKEEKGFMLAEIFFFDHSVPDHLVGRAH